LKTSELGVLFCFGFLFFDESRQPHARHHVGAFRLSLFIVGFSRPVSPSNFPSG
jgi:hypothetical protein